MGPPWRPERRRLAAPRKTGSVTPSTPSLEVPTALCLELCFDGKTVLNPYIVPGASMETSGADREISSMTEGVLGAPRKVNGEGIAWWRGTSTRRFVRLLIVQGEIAGQLSEY